MEYMKEVIEKFAASLPEQTKANADSKYNFDNDNRALIDAFAKIDEAILCVIGAAQKDIPKKAIKTKGEIVCPTCGKWVIDNENHKYCQWCGQKLDWLIDKQRKEDESNGTYKHQNNL